MLFALSAALIAIAAAYLLARPLFVAQQVEAGTTPEGPGQAVFRDQLAELERDLARGLIGAAEAEAARAEIARRILAGARDAKAQESGPARAFGPKAGLLLAGAVLVVASGLYLTQGTPGLPGLPFAKRASAPPSAALEARVRTLSAHLETQLEDAPAWAELGRTLMALGRAPQAAFALEQAVRLTGRQDAALLAAYTEARVWAIGGLISPEARRNFEAALALDPKEPRALYYLGLAALHDGDEAAARARWQEAEAVIPPDDPWHPRVRAALQALEAGETAALMPGPSAEAVRAVSEMTPEERQAMIAEMVGGLRARLEEAPEDMEGWLKLGQSYRVLEQPDEARYAYERALALDPQEPEALWQLGELEQEAGNSDAARTHWEALRAQVPEGSNERALIEKALQSLDGPAP